VVRNTPGQLLSGEPITDVVDAIADLKPLGILVNCTHPRVLGDTLEILNSYTSIPIGGYANVGYGQPEQEGTIEQIISPATYRNYVHQWLNYNTVLVGGCCGSTPEHISELYNTLKSA